MKLTWKIFAWALGIAFAAGTVWALVLKIPTIEKDLKSHIADNQQTEIKLVEKIGEIKTAVESNGAAMTAHMTNVKGRLKRIEDKIDER